MLACPRPAAPGAARVLLLRTSMISGRRAHRWIALLVVALGTTGCGAGAGWNARDAWSAPGAPLEESMLPSHESWTVADRPRSPLNEFVRFFFWLGSGGSGHVACGPDDDACAARLRSAPVHAADWNNRFPTL